MKNKKYILVSGGAGYIGSVTSKLLLENNNQVVIIDNLSTGRISAIPKGAIFIKGNIGDKNLLFKAFNHYKFDCVIHFAAHTRVEESMKDPKKYFENNVLSGLNLLQTMISTNCRKIVFSSSAAVYGTPEKLPVSEDAALNPVNPYGQTKKLFELILQEFAQAGLLDYIALRYFNVAGAYVTSDGAWGENHTPETHLIPLLLRSAQNKNKFVIYGDEYPTMDGTCIRDYVHVYDLAQAHILAMKRGFKGGQVYNVGIGRGYSNKEVLQTAQNISGIRIPYKIGPRRTGDCPVLVASSKKIKRELGFKPIKSDLKTIIQDTWNYYSLTQK